MIFNLLGYSGLSLLLLRLVIASIFLAHGWPKIKNLRQTAENFNNMGFVPGRFWGTVVALNEFFGGLALLTGFYSQVFALTLALQMVVAALWKMKRGQGLVGGYELDLLLVVSLLTVAVYGTGIYALENTFFYPALL